MFMLIYDYICSFMIILSIFNLVKRFHLRMAIFFSHFVHKFSQKHAKFGGFSVGLTPDLQNRPPTRSLEVYAELRYFFFFLFL